MSFPLSRYEAARAALAEARAVDEVKDLRDKAVALGAYARQAKDRGLEVDAAEIRFRAERRMGELTIELHAEGRIHKGGREFTQTPATGSAEEPVTYKLSDLGIDKKLSARAQQLAAIPEAEFDHMIGDLRARVARDGGRFVNDVFRDKRKAETRAQFRDQVRGGCTVEDLNALADGREKFGAILADPPWHFETYSAKGQDRAPGQHYRTDPLKAIAELPVAKLAAKDCTLFVWAIGPMLREALDLVDAWGFDLKTMAYVWMKTNADGSLFMGNGYWTRANAEICLLATRGAPMRLDNGVMQALLSPVQEHSRKPDEVHGRIERLVGGPYLELYGRRPRDGWVVWGNEIPREELLGGEVPAEEDIPRFLGAAE